MEQKPSEEEKAPLSTCTDGLLKKKKIGKTNQPSSHTSLTGSKVLLVGIDILSKMLLGTRFHLVLSLLDVPPPLALLWLPNYSRISLSRIASLHAVS